LIYNKFGNTGKEISRLGFGAMRLPETEINKKKAIDKEEAIRIIQFGIKSGINYIDSAYFYHDGESESVVGEAIQPFRDQIMLSTKSPSHLIEKPGDYRKFLEQQLTRLNQSVIDFYHFHGIGYQSFIDIDKKSGWIKEAENAKKEGLIKNISFSFHSQPEDIKKLADTGLFASLLCQYNILDRSNEEAIAYAREKGLGIIVMGPVGGGRIAGLPKHITDQLNMPVENNVELAFRFVWANPNVDCALSGMGSMEMVKENCEFADNKSPLSAQEVEKTNQLMKKLRKMADVYCTGCKYCLPCPVEIDIPQIFDLFNYYHVYGLKEHARSTYAEFGVNPWMPKVKADECIDCGKCESRCPQKIQIREQLKKAHKDLTS